MAGWTPAKIAFSVIALVGILAILGISIASLVIVVQNNDKLNEKNASPTAAPNPEKVINVRPNPQVDTKDEVKRKAYEQIVSMFKQSTNFNVDPCKDFYAYTCGAFKQNMYMSFDQTDARNYKTMSDQLEDMSYFQKADLTPLWQVKQLYEVCKSVMPNWDNYTSDAKQVFKHFDQFKKVAGYDFPMLHQSTAVNNLSSVELGTMLGFLSGNLGTDTFISQSVDTNWDDPNSQKGYALYIDQSTQVYQNSYYLKVWNQTKDKYAKEITERLTILADLQQIKLDPTQLAADVQSILNLEVVLATKMSTSDAVRRQYQRSYNPYTQKTAAAQFPYVDWKSYITNILQLADADVQKAVNNDVYEFYIMEPVRLAQLMNALKEQKDPFTSRQIVNYFYFRILMANAGNMPQPKTKVDVEESRRIGIDKRRHVASRLLGAPYSSPMKFDDDEEQLKVSCAGTTMNSLMYANARLFIDKIYPDQPSRDELRKHVGNLAESILTGMQSMIDQLSWMTHYTKSGAYSKIDNLIKNIGYPDFITNDTQLAQYYAELTYPMGEKEYFTIMDNINNFNAKVNFRQLIAGPNNRYDFTGAPGTTNAWYQPERNSITFPAAILQQPFYDFNWPAAVNFGAMGVIAGHELTHGFDDQGVQWDGTGVLTTWMDAPSNASFVQMAKCVINEYSGFCPLSGNAKPCVDGSQTQGENIADNGGIHSAYRAYKNYVNLYGADPALPDSVYSAFTQDQLFFLAFAQVWCQYPPSQEALLRQILVDPHSPSEQRVFGTLQNFPAFKNAFNCPAGSRYAPETGKHCDVWVSDIKPRKAIDASSTNIGQLQKSRRPSYKNITEYYMSSIDNTVDPCEDFYAYACGSFNSTSGFSLMQLNNLDNVGYVLNEGATDYNSQAVKKSVQLYKACQNFYDGAINQTVKSGKPVKSAIDGLRTASKLPFPLVDNTGAATTIDKDQLTKALGYLATTASTLISFNIDTNWRNPHSTHAYMVYIDQPSLQTANVEYQPEPYKILREGLVKQTRDILTYVAGPSVENKNIDSAKIQKLAEQLVDFEQTLVLNYSTSDDIRRQQGRMYNLYTIKQAQAQWNLINWQDFFTLAFTNSGLKGMNWNSFVFVINEPDQLTKLFSAIQSNRDPVINANVIANYIYYRAALTQQDYTPSALSLEAKLESLLNKKLGALGNQKLGFLPRVQIEEEDLSAQPANNRLCSNIVLGDIPYGHSRLFVDMMYPGQSYQATKQGVERVIDNILVGFRSMIDQLDWMTTSTKNGAYSKIDNIVKNIGFPDFVLNNTQLDSYYEDLVFTDPTDYVQMRADIAAFSNRQQFHLLTVHDTDRRDFGGGAATVNAWYNPEFNSITFPSGILQEPFFDPDWPAPAVFGAMGLVCGHELTHGFDDEGVQWDGTGVLSTWMDASSNVSFSNMAGCVVQQYDKFCPLKDTAYNPKCLSGTQTQGENIADNGGIHAAFRAYRDFQNINGPNKRLPGALPSEFTNDQIFFLSYAQVWCEKPRPESRQFMSLLTDPHSPSKYRILGPLQNFPAFQAAFNCKKGANYAPVDHCNVWISNATTGAGSSGSRANLKPAATIKADNPKYKAYSSAANFIRTTLNNTYDPCNNFYKYACGNYPAGKKMSFNFARDNNYIKMKDQFAAYNQTGWKSTDALSKVTKFYEKCVDYRKHSTDYNKNGSYVKSNVNGLKKLTGWAFTYAGETQQTAPTFDKATFSKVLAYLSAEHALNTLVSIGVDTNPDSANPDSKEFYQLQVDQNTLGFDKTFYADKKTWEYTKKNYAIDTNNLLTNFSKLNGYQVDAATVAKNVDDLLNFEYMIARKYSTDETTRRIFRRPGLSRCTVSSTGVLSCTNSSGAAYTTKIDCIDFNVYLTTLLKDYPVILKKVQQPNYNFWILETEKIGALCPYVMDNKNFGLITNYLYFRMLMNYAAFLPMTPTTSLYADRAPVLGQKRPSKIPFDVNPADTPEAKCAHDALNVMQFANARVYYDAVVTDVNALDNVKSHVKETIMGILGSMQGMLDQLDWLSDHSKEGARKKVQDLQINIAYPELVENKTLLNAYYSALDVQDTDTYYTLNTKLTKFNQFLQFNQLMAPKVARDDFLGAPGTVNAWYQPELNSITFPAGILVEPFYNPDWPASINFGAMGVISGHELTHGFDDEGVQYNGTGQASDWMDSSSKKGFHDMAQCVINEYDNFCFNNSKVAGGKVCVNGANTQGENIADNGGIHSAFRAYRLHSNLNGPDPLLDDLVLREFNHDQLFFLSFAQVWCQNTPTEDQTYHQILVDVHSPSRERVFGTIQNFPAFRSAFNCPANSHYAPEKHCNVWVSGPNPTA
uniref:Neprilysin n=1 Tax=Steinernema glaseri TaxID=37863 RepID=A0A1I7ZNT4_9BILA